MRGVSTRVTWMSCAKRSWPTPTVKTGIDRAFRLASGSSSAASDVSAPSVTMTRPASGRPDSSSRARSSAWPSRVAVPSYFRSAALRDAIGGRGEAEEAQDESLRQRVEQRGLRSARAAAARTRCAAGRRDRRSSCCASRRSGRRGSSAAERRPSGSASAGTGRRASTARSASRSADEHDAIARRAVASRRRGRSRAPRQRAPPAARSPSVVDREAANVKSPCSKTNAGYLKRNRKSQPTSRHSTQVADAASHVSSRGKIENV